MRVQPFAHIVRNICIFTAAASARSRPASHRTAIHASRTAVLKSSMPFGLFNLFSSSASSRNMSYPGDKGDEYYRTVLSPEQFRVIRGKGTEAPFTGEYDKHYPEKGVYCCAACNAPLYRADQKFKSGCGWPAFFDTVPGAVTRHEDRTLGMVRTEIVCSNCGGHLGHVFKGEGFPTPTDERHCVNSVSLKFSEDDKMASKADEGAAKV
ncbi:methionine-R-sulfoxide reductase [Verruconis gallopava]|uniref:Peptide-methionine (R)-S-oxide reductase n=1 Tax=Verruconis gallopava TaxID=253628 RepID=A0A0D1YU79_9PEZI|nr:methionine-R-sulfoxide reductase [Verruconis gallopava]KIW04237.1 methionine-R-sulfoxide reductase [Verruconis gallopava]